MAQRTNANEHPETRETQVLELAAEGLPDKEIARRLGISTDTVDTYWRRIRSRTGASSRTHAVAMHVTDEATGALHELAERVGVGKAILCGDAEHEGSLRVKIEACVPRHRAWPQSSTRFFGRENEIAMVRRFLIEEGRRLVTLHGSGGSGKTRLAIEAGRALAQEWEGRAWFVPLEDLSESRLIPGAILDSLGLKRRLDRTDCQQVCDALQYMEGPCLLVLDNLEQLLGAGETETVGCVARFLRDVPDLRCIITSRKPLGMEVEQIMPVSPLPCPTEQCGVEGFEIPSVQLFLDRAMMVRPDLSLGTGLESAIRIVRSVEGGPLAIELAAARARRLPLEQIAREVDSSACDLAVGSRDLPERHRSLSAALEWSYLLLPSELQRFFGSLSVFRGGFSCGAAAQLYSDPNIEPLLNELVDHSLVVADYEREEPRFRMPEVVRQFAQGKLGRGELDQFRLRHAQLSRQICRDHVAMQKESGWSEASRRMTAEEDNVHAAIEWLLDSQADTELCRSLVCLMAGYWEMRALWRLGLSYIVRALDLPGDDGRTAVLFLASALLFLTGNCTESEKFAREAYVAAVQEQDSQYAAAALEVLANVATARGSLQTTVELFLHSIDVRGLWLDRIGSNETEYLDNRRNSLGMLAMAEFELGRFEEALGHGRQARLLGGDAWERWILGQVAALRGERDTALEELGQAVEFCSRNGRPPMISFSRLLRGRSLLHLGDFASAVLDLECCLVIEREIGRPNFISMNLALLGEALIQIGKRREAIQCSYESLEAVAKMPKVRWPVVHQLYGYLAILDGDLPVAEEWLSSGLKIAQECEIPVAEVQGLERMAMLRHTQGRMVESGTLLRSARTIRERLGITVSGLHYRMLEEMGDEKVGLF